MAVSSACLDTVEASSAGIATNLKFPRCRPFPHCPRVNQPSSKFYTAKYPENCAIFGRHHGSGLTNMHGSTGDIVFLGTNTDHLEPLFFDLTHELTRTWVVQGPILRTPECCLGMSRCQFACFDTQEACDNLTKSIRTNSTGPAFPYKFKFKFDGCPNGCVASIARSDMSFIGTWRDDIRIDQAAVKAYVGGEFVPNAGAYAGRDWGKFDIQKEVINLCPTGCMRWDGSNSRSTIKNALAACTA